MHHLGDLYWESLILFQEVDNDPDINAAVEIEDHENGSEVDLEEKPHNQVELEIGGVGSPFMLRLLHLKQDTVPLDISVGLQELLKQGVP